MLTVNAVGIFFIKNNKYNFCYIQKTSRRISYEQKRELRKLGT